MAIPPKERGYEMKLQSAIGQFGQDTVIKWLLDRDLTHSVLDVSGNKKFQPDDVDLIWGLDTSPILTFLSGEVKTDRYYKTGNIFSEMVSNKEWGTDGWMKKCRAARLFYLFPDSGQLLVIPFEEFRRWAVTLPGYWDESDWIDVPNKNYEAGYEYTAQGFLIPITKICEDVPGTEDLNIRPWVDYARLRKIDAEAKAKRDARERKRRAYA